jgi:hypothetical protein
MKEESPQAGRRGRRERLKPARLPLRGFPCGEAREREAGRREAGRRERVREEQAAPLFRVGAFVARCARLQMPRRVVSGARRNHYARS